jgi:hypothetical protein
MVEQSLLLISYLPIANQKGLWIYMMKCIQFARKIPPLIVRLSAILNGM